jgi:RHS repeat-associated protein
MCRGNARKGLVGGLLALLAAAGLAQDRVDAIYEVAFPRVLDATTLADGIRVEVDCTGGGWLDVTEDLQVARAPHDATLVEMTASGGWRSACAYRLLVTPFLLDENGIPFGDRAVLLAREEAQIVPSPPAPANDTASASLTTAAAAPEEPRPSSAVSRAAGAGEAEVPQPNAPGAMVIGWSLSMDPATLAEGIVVERRTPGSGWVRVADEEVVAGSRANAPEDDRSVAVMLRSGWERGASYRIRLTAALKDGLGRALQKPETFEFHVPLATAENPAPPIVYSKAAPPELDSARASADTVGSRFPGGQNLLFHGLWTDPVTGLSYARARWYDARTGSFLSEDPLRDVDSPNLYQYGLWSSFNYSDPLGECVLWWSRTRCGRWLTGLLERRALGVDEQAARDRDDAQLLLAEYQRGRGRAPLSHEQVAYDPDSRRVLTGDGRWTSTIGEIRPDNAEVAVAPMAAGAWRAGVAAVAANRSGRQVAREVLASLGDDAAGEITGLNPSAAIPGARALRDGSAARWARTTTPWQRHVYQRTDIEWNRVRPEGVSQSGLTNWQAARRGYAPVRENPRTGKWEDVILHHTNQDPRGAVVEIWRSTHGRVPHRMDPPGPWRRERLDWSRAWDNEQSAYWRWRAGAYNPPSTQRLRLPGDER